jgi:hypothetical protein
MSKRVKHYFFRSLGLLSFFARNLFLLTKEASTLIILTTRLSRSMSVDIDFYRNRGIWKGKIKENISKE